MNTALWAVTWILAFAFLAAGAMKLATPREKLLANLPWAEDFSDGQVKAIGGVEVLAAIGLIAPALADTATWLVPAAAGGLVLTMVAALATHLKRKDGAQAYVVNLVLGGLALFVAVGRIAIEQL